MQVNAPAVRRLITGIGLFLLIARAAMTQPADVPPAVEKFDFFLRHELRNDGYHGLIARIPLEDAPATLDRLQAETGRRYNVVIHGDAAALDDLGTHVNSRHEGFATARLTAYELAVLGGDPRVARIEKGGTAGLALDRSLRSIRVDEVHGGAVYNVPYRGRGTIIGIIDTGIDAFHPDFRDPGDPNRSRVVSIWDVELEPIGTELPPEGFDYGVEYTRDAIERDLSGATHGAVRSPDADGHGTHVAGIAGGNGGASNGRFTGAAPDAEFIIVSFPGGRFGTAQQIDAMNYIFTRAAELGKPAVVNMSLGGHGGSHDGTAAHEMAIDFHAGFPGRAVVVASGNSGSDEIHHTATLPPGGSEDFTLSVPAYTPGTEDDEHVRLFIWYESPDPLEVTVSSPGEYTVTAASGDSAGVDGTDGLIVVDSFEDFINPLGARLFFVELAEGSLAPAASGNWNIGIVNRSSSRETQFNAWIISSTVDDFPNTAFFDPSSGRRYTVSLPGTAAGAVTVGAYVTRNQWIDRFGSSWGLIGNPPLGTLVDFSGGGPTRDGRMKPDITAPGTAIAAPLSSNASFPNALLHSEDGYAFLTGTSMATPHITGVAALLFEANPTLTGLEIADAIRQSGRGDGLTGGIPNFDWGYGKADARAAFDFIEILHGTPEEFHLLQNYPNPFNSATTILFTVPQPTFGRLTVYDILGRKVRTLFEGQLDARIHSVQFDGSDLSSGVYLYYLEADRHREAKKMLLLR
jgi:minor extracellular serine protease Vpr